jgi:hypothetical protein
MGRINRRILFRLATTVMASGLICPLFIASGCSTASWVIHHNGSANDLAITEADVDAMIDELSTRQSQDTKTIQYNGDTDRYELTPDIYRKAVRDGVIRRIQDKKITEFLKSYRPDSLTDALKKDMGTGGTIILLLGILGGLFY